MPRLTSDLSSVQEFQPLPRGIYQAVVVKAEYKKSKNENPMCVLDWKILEGEGHGKEIRFDHLLLGGKTQAGGDMPLFRLCNFLDATGTPWGCTACNSPEEGRRFHIGTGPEGDGLVKGKYYCPDCKTPELKITYDTDNFLSQRARIKVTIGSISGSDREKNEIDGYMPYEA